MKMPKVIFSFLAFLLFIQPLFAQNIWEKSEKSIETGVFLGIGKDNPLWLYANQYGIVPMKPNFATFRYSQHKEYDSLYVIDKKPKLKTFDFGYGISGVANLGMTNQILLPEAYIKARIGIFEIYGGRRREIMGLVDTTLTTGSYIWSGNAMPIPKIQISIPNYVSIFGHGFIAIKGQFSHGWFGSQPYVQHYFLHQKSLYGRIGREQAKFKFYSGINNEIQWGGYSALHKNDSLVSNNGYYASGFNTFMNAAFPFSFIRKKFPPNTVLETDVGNYGGNVLGSVDFMAELNIRGNRILAYRQIPYELGSLFTSFVNADDGLYGLSIKFNKPKIGINKITIEGLHTNNQGTYRANMAKLLNLKDKHHGELQNYLNHGQYNDGWSYNGFGIGTPLIINNHDVNDKLNVDSTMFSSYNKVKSISILADGQINKITYTLNYTYAQNSSFTIWNDINNNVLNQHTFMILLRMRGKKSDTYNLKIAGNSGKLLNNALGLSFVYKKILK